eukprot:m.867503 g.867503  ORF g.867503 m.867503 type:complete len:168 (-) comp23555_c0_seq11:2808-3311(-)
MAPRVDIYNFVLSDGQHNLRRLFKTIDHHVFPHVPVLLGSSDPEAFARGDLIACANTVIAKHMGVPTCNEIIGATCPTLNRKTMTDTAYRSLLLWAAIMGKWDLAKFFWERGGQSISTAVFIAMLLRRLSVSPFLCDAQYQGMPLFSDAYRIFYALSSHARILLASG